MSEHLGSSTIVKLGIVTDDVERTAAAYRTLFAVGPVPATQSEPHPPFTIEPFKTFRGQPCGETPLKVVNHYTENFWFEIVQPLDDTPSPWSEWLREHGTSVCFTSIHIGGGLSHDTALLESLGFPQVFLEDKGYERYAYFDTAAVMGLLVEVKERLPK
jgi:hypothetical protein